MLTESIKPTERINKDPNLANTKMKITIDQNLSIELINEEHSKPIFEMVDQNRTYLRE